MPADGRTETLVRENLRRVRERIALACNAAGRSANGVTLVGVSKYVGPEETAALFHAGVKTLGEARPQQLWSKAGAAPLSRLPIDWRLIGHLQRNKVDRTVPVAESIDSVDSRRLLASIDRSAAAHGKRQGVLLEVNISGDAEKHGFTANEVRSLLEDQADWPHAEIRGLMGMAAREGGPDTARRNFASLRELRDELATDEAPLAELSMGMSGDLEAAIAEGATHVRVGRALWEGVA